MVEAIVASVIIGSVIVLAGRSFCRNMTVKENSCACGMKACPPSGCCNQITEKMNEE